VKPRDLSRGVVTYGIINVFPSDEKNQYVIEKEQQVVTLLIRYKPNVLLQRFKDTWAVDFPLSSKVIEKKKPDNKHT